MAGYLNPKGHEFITRLRHYYMTITGNLTTAITTQNTKTSELQYFGGNIK